MLLFYSLQRNQNLHRPLHRERRNPTKRKIAQTTNALQRNPHRTANVSSANENIQQAAPPAAPVKTLLPAPVRHPMIPAVPDRILHHPIQDRQVRPEVRRPRRNPRGKASPHQVRKVVNAARKSRNYYRKKSDTSLVKMRKPHVKEG